MVLSKLKAELSSFYARGNSSYIRLIPTYFTYFWSCFKHLQVNKKHENSFEDSEYLFNLNPPQPPPPPSVELLIFFHFWHQSRFLWLLENGEQEKLQLLSSAFIWVERVFISSVHQNFYHIYILHRASISVSFFASPVSENILSYVFFFQCPYPSSDSCLSITFSCRYIDLYLMCFFFFQEMCLYECYLSSSVKLIYSTVTQSPKGSCHHIIITISQNIQQESLQTTSNKKQPTIVLLPHVPDLNIMSQH